MWHDWYVIPVGIIIWAVLTLLFLWLQPPRRSPEDSEPIDHEETTP